MKSKLFYLVIGSGAVLILVCMYPTAQAATGVPKIISYQGRLFDTNGNLLGGSGTQYCFQFSIWNAATGGSQVWPAATSSIMTVTVQNGIFNVGVGDVSAGGDALTFDFQSNDTVYLDVAIATKVDAVCTGGNESFEHLSPRQRITASGYAINSLTVGGFTPSQQASSSQIPVLSSGNLILGGVNPQINATGTNTLTLQGGAGTGAIQFFNANSFINSSGALTVASTVTANMLQLTASSNQLLFKGSSATGTLTWTPSVSGVLTIPNFATATDTLVTTNFAQTLSGKTLNAPSIVAGMSIVQNAASTGVVLNQNGAGVALSIVNTPGSAQSTSTVAITTGANVSGAALLVTNFGTGNALQVNDSSTAVFTINNSGNIAFSPSTNSSTAFVVQNASGTNVFSADTINNDIKVGPNGAPGSVPTLFAVDIKSDAGDPTGFDGAMYYNSSTDRFRCYQGGAWQNCVLQSDLLDYQQHFITSRWGYWSPTGVTQTTMTAVNMVAPTVTGTAAASAQAEDYYIQWTSSGATGAIAGLTQAFTQTQARYTPRVATRIRTDTAITNRRIWFALSSAAITSSDETAATATVIFGLRYSTAASDTTWKCGSGDGTNVSYIDTGVIVSTSSYYDFVLDATIPGQLTCEVAKNGGSYVSVTKNTNVSTSTTALGVTDAATALTAAAIVHRSAYVYLGGRGN